MFSTKDSDQTYRKKCVTYCMYPSFGTFYLWIFTFETFDMIWIQHFTILTKIKPNNKQRCVFNLNKSL